jgi:hypothetical protein
MTIVLFILLVSLFAGGSLFVLDKAKTKEIIAGATLSPVAKQVLAEYNALPVENRPFTDIVSILKALDEKTSVDAIERDRHFNRSYIGPNYTDYTSALGYDFVWDKGYNCYHNRDCIGIEYIKLHKAILEVAETNKEKARALAVSSYDGDAVKELEQRLRDEATLNREFVQEFKELT